MLPATRDIVKLLRERNRRMRPNAQSVDNWVEKYVEERLLHGQAMNFLTQWCISPTVERRFERKGPTRKERLLFERDIPEVAGIFFEHGCQLNWWLTFNRPFPSYGVAKPDAERWYMEMITGLAEGLQAEGWLQILNWEDDVLGERPQPAAHVLENLEGYIGAEAFAMARDQQAEFCRRIGIALSSSELERATAFKIACEAEEGRLLEEDSPFGECLLLPLEAPEQYDFFTILAPGFKRRIVAVLPAYPWRWE